MKTLHLSLCFILFAIYTISAQEPAPVVDINGNQVQVGVDYYILPVFRGRGGGLTLDSTGNETCPLDVVQAQSEVDSGLPLYLQPVDPMDQVVRVSTDHNFIFNASSTCIQTTVWTLQFDESVQRYIISTGGEAGNPGRETLSNWFKIERYERNYKLVFCPGVCDTCRPICGDIGVFVQDDGQRRLTLNLNRDEPPFMVMFRRFDLDDSI